MLRQMEETREEFGRKTVLAAADLLKRLGHSGLTKFLLSHELENTTADNGRSLDDRSNALARFLLENPGLSNEDGCSVRSAVVRDAVAAAVKWLGMYNENDPTVFEMEYPELVTGLAKDGFSVHAGELRASLPISQIPLSSEVYSTATSPRREEPPMSDIRVFISHSSKDANFVRLLIDLLRSALNLPADQIRCTSVDGYRLPSGASAAEHLRREIPEAHTFIGVISPHSLKSLYVVFELGARWGAHKHLIPVLAPGVDHSVLAAPLSDLNAIESSQPAQLHQLIGDLARALNVTAENPSVYQRNIELIQQQVAAPSGPADQEAQTQGPQDVISVEAQQLLLEAIKDPDPTISRARASDGVIIQANRTNFTDGVDRRTMARWDAAIDQLERYGWIKDLGYKGEVFELTSAGWDLAEQLKAAHGE